MICIYYHVLSIDEYKSKMVPFFDEGRKFGLVSIEQKRSQPEFFMEFISARESVGEQLKGLSELRARMGINNFLLNNKIHVDIFDKLLDVAEDGTTRIAQT